jgi:UDP-glucose 4-epimerase
MKVLVTGAAGYIGGQTVLHLRDRGHEVVGLDLRAPSDAIRAASQEFMIADISHYITSERLRTDQFDAVIHCAGTSLVGPSMRNPREYYENNFVKTQQLVEHLLENSSSTRFIFSSSASVYGNPVMTPCSEVDLIMPMSPYGESKAMIEWMLASYAKAYRLDSVSFRYFNACGADPQARHGQEAAATHIIARVLESIRDHAPFTIYGDQYPTFDGTCVRDYVHVADIAEAHCRALDRQVQAGVYNLGTGEGHSVREIIDEACRVTGRDVEVITGEPRAGDPPELTATAAKYARESGWKTTYKLSEIISHAWAWYQKSR